MKKKGLILGICVVLLLVLTTVDTQARCGGYYNPLVLPFAVAGAVVGTAAAVATAVVPAPVCAYPGCPGPPYYAPPRVYYGPGPYYARPAWIPGHYNRYGYWVPGHWR